MRYMLKEPWVEEYEEDEDGDECFMDWCCGRCVASECIAG